MKRETVIDTIIKNCSRYYSPNTHETYERYIRQFFEFCPKEIGDIAKHDIINWLAHLKKKGRSSRTRDVGIAAVKAFFGECKYKKVVIVNPTIKIEWTKHEELNPRPLESEVVFRLKEAVKEYPRDRAIVEVLHRTGVRVSELINIQIEDIWFDERQVWIRKGKGLKERSIPISRICSQYLKEYLATRRDENPYLFITKRGEEFKSRQSINKLLRKYCEEAGIDTNVSPHDYRHTFITELIEKGADEGIVADMSGHVNVDSLQSYARASDAKLKIEYDRT